MPGSTLVVLPPLANDPEALEPLELDALGSGADRISVFRYPGHGGRRRQEGLRFADIADEVVARHEGPLDIVGLAIGSYVAAELLIDHADRIRSVLVSSSPFTDITSAQRDLDRARALASADGMERLVEETLARWFTPLAIGRDVPGVRVARDRLLAMEPGVWSDFWLAIAERTTIGAERAVGIDRPVTVVAPLHDGGTGRPGLELTHRILPRSRLLYVDGPHMVNLERPRNVLAAIDNHLAWVASGGPDTREPLYLAGS